MTLRTPFRVALALLVLAAAAIVPLAQQAVPADTTLPPWQPVAGSPGRFNQRLVGDRRQPGVFIERVKFPKGFSGAPHAHDVDGYVTILKGELTVGFGNVVDSSKVLHVRAGGFIILPKGVPHYEWFREETIEHVEGVGPMTTWYVDSTGREKRP